MLKMAKNGSLAITVLVFLLFVMRSMKKLKKPKVTENVETLVKKPVLAVEEPSEEETVEKVAEAKRVVLRKQVVDKIKSNPGTVANSLKRWIAADMAARNE